MSTGTWFLISSCSGWCLKLEWWHVWKETTIYTLKGAAIGWAKKMEWSCWKLESRDFGISTGRKILNTVTVVTSKIEKLPKESMTLTRSSKQTVQSMNCILSFDWWGLVRVIKRLPSSTGSLYCNANEPRDIQSWKQNCFPSSFLPRKEKKDYENKTWFQVKTKVLPVKYNLRISIKTKV